LLHATRAPLDLEVDHFGHDECANAHPHHAAEAGDHQALVGNLKSMLSKPKEKAAA
jgi:hypothetical protein